LVVNQVFIHFVLSIGTNLLNKQKMNNQNLLSIKTLLMGVVISAGTMIISCKTLPAQTISGTVKEMETGIAIPYANIALFDSTTTILMAGSISNDDGEFQIKQAPAGNFKLRISAIGYETYLIEIEKKDVQDLNIDPIHLSIQDYMLDGVIIESQRIRAKAEAGKTTFLINTSMQNASHTGVDILKLIPGIQVDIRQNVSLEGSRDILILVDGRERDRSFLSQLSASQIDRVELISNPSSRYDASVPV
jgi:iron complex outermembrane recepter protein